MPVEPLVLFQEQKREHRMRSQTYKTRYPPPKHPSHAFDLVQLPQQRHQAIPVVGAHHPRLDNVDGTAHRRRDEPS